MPWADEAVYLKPELLERGTNLDKVIFRLVFVELRHERPVIRAYHPPALRTVMRPGFAAERLLRDEQI